MRSSQFFGVVWFVGPNNIIDIPMKPYQSPACVMSNVTSESCVDVAGNVEQPLMAPACQQQTEIGGTVGIMFQEIETISLNAQFVAEPLIKVLKQ